MSVLSWKRVEPPAPLEPISCARCSFLISVEWESRNVFLIHTHTILNVCLYVCTQVCTSICVCIFLSFIFLSVPQTFFSIFISLSVYRFKSSNFYISIYLAVLCTLQKYLSGITSTSIVIVIITIT